MTKPKPPEMETISPETYAKLRAIKARIDELRAQIKELEEEAYWLVPKHTFDECKAMGCDKTYRNRLDCHCSCVRRKGCHGCFIDYYAKMKPVIKPHVVYPTLGWKKVTSPGMQWRGEWHGGWDVVKETEKTLVLSDKSILLKSTIHLIEDVIYISGRSGRVTYFCAGNPETLDMQKALLKMWHDERSEKVMQLVTPMLDGPTNKYSGVEQQEGETQEEYENRIFGED